MPAHRYTRANTMRSLQSDFGQETTMSVAGTRSGGYRARLARGIGRSCSILVICLIGTRSAATENDDRLKKIVADWNKRRDCVSAVHYFISGKTTYPAGST